MRAVAVEIRQKEESALEDMQGRLLQANAAIVVSEREARSHVNTFVAEQRQKLSDASRQVEELSQGMIKANENLNRMTIRSPIDGVVQASAISTPGQVVQPGAELMRVVPRAARLEIEAYLPNRDIGFITEGQAAVIKVEAFPFTRYGTIPGRVAQVATDAVPEPDAQQLEQAAAQELQAVVPRGNVQRMQNLVFSVLVEPHASSMVIEGKHVPLSPGMAVTVEITTGKRRIIDYLLAPVARVLSESVHER